MILKLDQRLIEDMHISQLLSPELHGNENIKNGEEIVAN